MTLDTSAYAEKRARRTSADRLSGVIIAILLLGALALAGSQIYAVANGPLPPGVGELAPNFEASTPQGAVMALEGHRGDVVLVDFWATWCPPCVASMPTLSRLHTEYESRGFKVLGVNQEPGSEQIVRRFMQSRRISFETVIDPGPISHSYGVFSFPTSFLVDREGKILATYRGVASEKRLRADIEAALGPPA